MQSGQADHWVRSPWDLKLHVFVFVFVFGRPLSHLIPSPRLHPIFCTSSLNWVTTSLLPLHLFFLPSLSLSLSFFFFSFLVRVALFGIFSSVFFALYFNWSWTDILSGCLEVEFGQRCCFCSVSGGNWRWWVNVCFCWNYAFDWM